MGEFHHNKAINDVWEAKWFESRLDVIKAQVATWYPAAEIVIVVFKCCKSLKFT